ncbi:MAG: helix-turn-helix domain-containing protein [bacterium]
MSEQLLKVLLRCGLDVQEATTYLKMLTTGPSSVLKIAATTNMDRMTTHRVIQRLVGKKLIGTMIKGKRHLYFSNKPESLAMLFEDQEESLRLKRKHFQEVFPQLAMLHSQGQHKPLLNYYEGEEGFREVIKLILTEMVHAQEKVFRVYTTQHRMINKFIYRAYPLYYKKKREYKLSAKVISHESFKYKLRDYERDEEQAIERRLIPEKFAFSSNHYLLDKTIILISFEDDYCRAVTIENMEYLSSQKQIFDFVWQHAIPVSSTGKQLEE